MTLRLTNTMKRQREPFAPTCLDHVTMQVCGPTVYNFAQVGNARPAVVFDVLYRLLKRRLGRVVHARNFTDGDDQINAAATEHSKPISFVVVRPANCAMDLPLVVQVSTGARTSPIRESVRI